MKTMKKFRNIQNVLDQIYVSSKKPVIDPRNKIYTRLPSSRLQCCEDGRTTCQASRVKPRHRKNITQKFKSEQKKQEKTKKGTFKTESPNHSRLGIEKASHTWTGCGENLELSRELAIAVGEEQHTYAIDNGAARNTSFFSRKAPVIGTDEQLGCGQNGENCVLTHQPVNLFTGQRPLSGSVVSLFQGPSQIDTMVVMRFSSPLHTIAGLNEQDAVYQSHTTVLKQVFISRSLD